MRIVWRYICIFRDPITRRCLRWIRIPIIIWVYPYFEFPPRPDPWFGGERIRPELAHDLQVLATIDALAQTLSEGLQKPLLEAVQLQFDNVKLPEGMELASPRDLEEGGAKSS